MMGWDSFSALMMNASMEHNEMSRSLEGPKKLTGVIYFPKKGTYIIVSLWSGPAKAGR